MNEWLGEPVPGFQLPGRGILRNFIKKVVIWNNLIILMKKQKTIDNFTCRLIFLIGKTKDLQVRKFVKMNLVKVQFFTCRFLFSLLGKQKIYRWQPPVDFLLLFVNNLFFISLCFINEITENVSFPGSWKTGTGFSQLRVHTGMVGRVPLGH